MNGETSSPDDSLLQPPTNMIESVEVVKLRRNTSDTDVDGRNISDSDMDEMPSTPRSQETSSSDLFLSKSRDMRERKCWGGWLVQQAPFSYLQRTPLLTASPSSSVTSVETVTSVYPDDYLQEKPSALDRPLTGCNENVEGEAPYPNHCQLPQLSSTKMNIYVPGVSYGEARQNSTIPTLPELKEICSMSSKLRCRSEPAMDKRSDVALPKVLLPVRRDSYADHHGRLLQGAATLPSSAFQRYTHHTTRRRNSMSHNESQTTSRSRQQPPLDPATSAAPSKHQHAPSPLPQTLRLQRPASEPDLPRASPGQHCHRTLDMGSTRESQISSNMQLQPIFPLRLLPRTDAESSIRRRRRHIAVRSASGDLGSDDRRSAFQSHRSVELGCPQRPRRGSADSVHEPFTASFSSLPSDDCKSVEVTSKPELSPQEEVTTPTTCRDSDDDFSQDQPSPNEDSPIVYCFPEEDDDPNLESPSFCGVMGLTPVDSCDMAVIYDESTPDHSLGNEQDIANLRALHLSYQREATFHQAETFEAQGRLSSALECFEKCLNWIDVGGGTQLDIATVYHKIGVIRWKMGAYEESLRVLTLSLDSFQQLFGCSVHNDVMIMDCPEGDAHIFAEILISFGRVFLSLGEHRKAWRHFERSVHILKCLENSVSGFNTSFLPILARALLGLGMVDEAVGRYSRAMNYFNESLRLQRASTGPSHLDIAATLTSMGGVEEKCGRYLEAMDRYSEALGMYRSDLRSSPVDIAVTLTCVGWIHYIWGELGSAMQVYSDALGIMKAVLGDDHRNVASIMFQIGLIYSQEARYSEAIGIFKDVLVGQKKALGPEHLDVAITLDSISDAYDQTQQFDRAVAFLTRALRIRCNALGKRHLHVGMTLERLGLLHVKKGDMETAEMCYLDALRVYEAKKLGDDDASISHLRRALRDIQAASKMVTDRHTLTSDIR